ncbi:FIST signal transduction protein [Caldimonas tepidiphila]|uniref:FIST signal transduction protein n=1 Tax=Caldimonas tepidiphila TaxID=2315841 RepID=UPI000E5C55A5|nr:FIST N-terminal domain-containing protein [Caldimonas tepidiphila]
MTLFPHAHATHPQWEMALTLAIAQLEGLRRAPPYQLRPTIGWVYLTDHYAVHAPALLERLHAHYPGVHWIGTVGVGVSANGVEYFDEPGLALMLGDIPAEQFRVFSGVQPLPPSFAAHTAQVHADPTTPDMAELVGELATRTATGYLFGGLAAARTRTLHIADEVFHGGLSGVAFSPEVALLSRVTQGCQPVGPARTITEVEQNVIATLDGEPALGCLLADLGLEGAEPREALPKLQTTLVGLFDGGDDGAIRRGQFGEDVRVRHLIGIDPHRYGIAVADRPEPGMQLAFCRRHADAARRDLMRICAEIREELEPQEVPLETALALSGEGADAAPHPARGISGAIYVSCSGRGGPHFGSPGAELQLVRHALGDVPLVGFFAGGEIARHHLYGYTGVLTVFTA